MDFILPDDFDRLAETPSDGRYWVKSLLQADLLTEDEQAQRLKAVRTALFSEEAGVLEVPSVFEDLYWFVSRAGKLSEPIQTTIGDLVMAGVVQITRLEEEVDLGRLAMCIKMLVLLLAEWLKRVQDFSPKKVKETMSKLVSYDLSHLWKGRAPEIRFVSLVMSMMFPLISKGVNPSEQTAWLLSYATADMWQGWLARITQMLFSNEKKDQSGLISTIIEVVKDKPDLAAGLLKEVAENLRLTENQQADSESIRNVSLFIEELGSKLPQLFITGLPLIIHLLDCESYILRNGIVSAIKSFLKYLLKNEGEGGTEEQTALEKRNKLFDILEQRTRDKSAYSRTRTLEALRELVQGDEMPIDRYINAVKIAKERLMDVTALVRKGAGKLLLMILFKDKFENGPEYKTADELVHQLEEVKATAEQLKTSDCSEEDRIVATTKLGWSVRYLSQYIDHLNELAECTAILLNLLHSKQVSDVQNAIEVLYLLQSKGVRAAAAATRKIIPLIWSKEESVRHAVTFGFHGVYTNLEYIQPDAAVAKLMQLYVDLTPGERSSLEDLFTELHRAKLLSPVFSRLFKKKYSQAASVSLAFFIRCTLAHEREAFMPFYERFYRQALKCAPAWDILKEVMTTVMIIGPCGDKSEALVAQSAAKLWDDSLAFSPSWFGCAEQVIRAVSSLSSESLEIQRKLLIELTKPLLRPKWCEEDLAKCLFVAGEVCLKVLVAGDKLKSAFQMKKSEEIGKLKDKELEEISGLKAAELSNGLEALTQIQEHHIIYRNMLGIYTPLAQRLMANIQSVKSPITQQAALLAFSKFLCTSEHFCKSNLQLLFNVIENPDMHPSIRCNGIVALGDLAQRFPLVIEPYSDRLFSKLRDTDSGVKSKSMLVLTHLVLNDMLKLKGQAADVLLCLLDPEVKNLATLFLEELNKKDNAVLFNVVPEALSKLIPMTQISTEQFKVIIDRVFKYIEKERMQENLVDKLCSKMLSAQENSERLRISYCLNKVVGTERTLKKLMENLAIWQAAVLQDPEVKDLFEDMRIRTNKVWKSENRNLLEEFESRLKGVVEERRHKAPRRR